MEIRSLTAAPEIGSFRLRQTIETRYRDMPELDNTATMSIAARRDPPAVETRLSSNGGPASITLLIDDELWSRSGDVWTQTTLEETPANWTLNAYRELGEISLVAPLRAAAVIAASEERGAGTAGGITVKRFSVGTELMVRLLTEDFEARQANLGQTPLAGATPPASYINRYEADFWVDPDTGFVLRETTVVEYTEERLHGRATGTGPATFTTTREFHTLNAEVEIERPA